ncbi:hypothetical protein LCGC14_0755390 [marine sediment metagenome]|uniref:Uncharacterized protein n=1 Tax=marine sediment metagenome TaxID=412755 RepID=A0A0F9SMX7_9ZZZZ
MSKDIKRKESIFNRLSKASKRQVRIRNLKGFTKNVQMEIKVQSVKYIRFSTYSFIFYLKDGRELGRVRIKAQTYKIAKEKFKKLI